MKLLVIVLLLLLLLFYFGIKRHSILLSTR